MACKFYGTFKELKGIIEEIGYLGGWRKKSGQKKTFLVNNGAILNWWVETGSINFQGPSESKEEFENIIMPLLLKRVREVQA